MQPNSIAIPSSHTQIKISTRQAVIEAKPSLCELELTFSADGQYEKTTDVLRFPNASVKRGRKAMVL